MNATSLKPNVLFVFSDQHRAVDMSCYGNTALPTPNFDRLAAAGVRADCAVSNTPVCCPFRASLMTGMYAFKIGMPSNYQPLDSKGPFVAEHFRQHGYRCGYVGKWHLHFPTGDIQQDRESGSFVPPGQRLGFDDFWAASNSGHNYHNWKYFRDTHEPIHSARYQPDEQVDLALSFIETQAATPDPWCLFLSWGPPHTPFDPLPAYRKAHQDKALRANVPAGPASDFARENQPGYHGLIASLDNAFGRLMVGLEAAGQLDNTIVVYTSDHGEMLGSHGCRGNKRWPFNEAVRIPLIVRYPGVIPAGTTTNQAVSVIDFFPTLCELAGLDIPAGLDGISAAPLFRNGRDERREAFAYCPMHYAYVPWPGWRAVVNAQWTYAETVDGPWVLFDNVRDPLQLHNLVHEASAAATLQSLREVLRQRMQTAGDSWEFRRDFGDYRNWNLLTSSHVSKRDFGVPIRHAPATMLD